MESDRIGLVVVLASLGAIAAIVFLVFQFQADDRVSAIRSQGGSLVRALAAIPYRQLEGGGEQQGVMRVLQYSAADDDFAYVSVVGRDGTTVNEVVSGGFFVPRAEMPVEPASWLGEKQLDIAPDGRKVIEFHAPLLENGELQGFVRLGYLYPHSGLDMAQLPFLAMVALPVFLLVPLFYLLLKLEVRPVRAANREISRFLEGESLRTVEVAATGELGDFVRRFNAFIERANSRIHSLEEDQARLITSAKLLTYRKNRVETVLETLPEAVLILDESGAITFANQKLAAMFGVSRQAILERPPQEWCDNPDVLQLLSKHQGGGKNRTFTDTIRFSIEAVASQSIVTKTYPLFAPKSPSAAIGTLIIFRDETREALARNARGEFVAHLSHELKSPLNVLGIYSELLLSESGKEDELRIEAANVIGEEVARLSNLINSLLSMTQIENGSLTPDKSLVRLRDVATSAFEEARHMAGAEALEFEFDAPKEMNPIHVDKDLMRIALTNLLSNAVKYNRAGGIVKLSIEETEDAIQIRVADTGIGVGDDEAGDIFEKFYRSPDERVRAVGGHGLGLALTKQIVDLHHGSLTLDHDRAEGAEFIINLWKETTMVRQAI